MNIIDGNSKNFEEIVLKEKGKVVVDFNADWCGPCQMIKPILEEIANDNNEIKIISVNIDDEDELATKYGIMSIPCLVLFENGLEVRRSIGFKPKSDIESFIGE